MSFLRNLNSKVLQKSGALITFLFNGDIKWRLIGFVLFIDFGFVFHQKFQTLLQSISPNILFWRMSQKAKSFYICKTILLIGMVAIKSTSGFNFNNILCKAFMHYKGNFCANRLLLLFW